MAKRAARADMRGRVALVTGGRAKIGMYVALRLLRDGAHVTITTRFPRDAARRFVALAKADASNGDSGPADWLDRLTIVSIDLRDPRQVLALAAMFPVLDVLVNNAAQTIRRSAGAYAPLVEGEHLPLEGAAPEIRVLGGYVQSLLPALDLPSPLKIAAEEDTVAKPDVNALVYAVAPTLRAQLGPPRLDVLDAAGLQPDSGKANTWTNPIGSVPAAEVLEVQLCNAVAPFLLLNSLRPALVAASSQASPSRRYAYVVNVTAAEGQFHRYKTPGHAHTNMAKAGLNMLTRTVGAELAACGVLVTSVDTGWVTDERPWEEKCTAAAAGFTCPLDLEDGAARVYDPIVRGEAGEALHSVLLKDYGVAPW
jgi:NAD(P)-dependent dehydrogenase (short-subunit alcohol dehydrogenase family)